MHSHSTDVTIGISFLLGVFHAMEPGHGKTAMLVYMLGSNSNRWHPIIIGLSSAISHSLSLLSIAFCVHLVQHALSGDHLHDEMVSYVMQWIGSLLLAGVGLFLLWQSRHGPGCGCAAHRTPVPELVALTLEPVARAENRTQKIIPPKESLRTTALLGLAIGLLPCPSAMAAFFAGMSHGEPVTAYLIVALFSAGVGCSLTLAGFMLQYFGEKLTQRASRLRHWPWAKVRAWLILGTGLLYLSRLII